MQTSDLFRWLFTATGLWLILSPFMIFNQSALSQDVVTNEAGTLMAFGLLALVIAGFCYKRRCAIQIIFGIVLGVTLILSPWMFGFSDNALATWHTGLIGLGVLVTTLIALLKPQSELRSW